MPPGTPAKICSRSVTLRWAQVGNRGLPASGAGGGALPNVSAPEPSPHLMIDLEGKLAQEHRSLEGACRDKQRTGAWDQVDLTGWKGLEGCRGGG